MPMQAPYYPLIYVRGYAASQAEIESTVADPYMGFNLGSMKLRQRWTGDIQRYIFESPLIRLMKDHGYLDVYHNGSEIDTDAPVPERSLWIYRYYEPASADLGDGQRGEIENYARDLDDFIESIRDRICGSDLNDPAVVQQREDFRVYLLAHSMGGLIVRCYLQNIRRGQITPVDKVFTFATPHGGIDMRLVGNLPGFIGINNVNNFNTERMREYLKIDDTGKPVNSLDGCFPPERFFCLVGSNHRDYTVANSMARRLVGPMSDGLVRISHAAVERAPRAFVHRSHSGDYGIVNSEEGYQNLVRFLFGDVQIDGLLRVTAVTLPTVVDKARQAGKQIRASYHIETIGRVRGARWDLHRRLVDEASALFESYDKLMAGNEVHLFTTYLADWARVKRRGRTLGFSLDLRVLVPEYEIDGSWFADQHYDGGYLFRDKINLEIRSAEDTSLRYGWDSDTPNRTTRNVTAVVADGYREYRIPVVQKSAPGLEAELIIRARPWGEGAA